MECKEGGGHGGGDWGRAEEGLGRGARALGSWKGPGMRRSEMVGSVRRSLEAPSKAEVAQGEGEEGLGTPAASLTTKGRGAWPRARGVSKRIDRGAGAASAPRAAPSIRAAVRLQLEKKKKKSLLSSQQRPARRPGPPASEPASEPARERRRPPPRPPPPALPTPRPRRPASRGPNDNY